jgi:hypothetical protein
MKTLAITSLLCLTAAWAQAQEVGQVISRTPVYQQVAVPRQTCIQTPAAAPAPTSGGGAILGAIAGGLIGSQLGGRDSQGITAMAGAIGGAVLGNKVEGQGNPSTPQTTCSTQTFYENRLVGFHVVYEFAGKQYNVQLPQDPGTTIPLQITPLNAPRSQAPADATVISSRPIITTVVTEPNVVYVPSTVYRTYPPVYTNINLGWGWQGGYGGPRHGHWR